MQKDKQKTKKILKIVGNVILWLFLILCVIITIMAFTAQSNKSGLPTMFGKNIVSVQTGSMTPTINAGDMIISDALSDSEKTTLQKDDVITFVGDANEDGEPDLNTHRIVDVKEDGGHVYYQTKGDKYTDPDKQWVESNSVYAKWTGTRLRGLGKVLTFLQSSVGFLCIVVLPMVAFFLYCLIHFVIVVVRMRNKNKVSEEQAMEIKQLAIKEYLEQQLAEQQQKAEEQEKTDDPKE